MKNNILLDQVINEKRIIVTFDQYNWIVKFGSANWKASMFRRKADTWYFTDFESLLTRVGRIMLRYNLQTLDYGDVLEAISETERNISSIGTELDKKIGVQIGCR